MGFPSHVIPVDLIAQDRGAMTEAGQEELMKRQMCSANLAGVMDGYRYASPKNDLFIICGFRTDLYSHLNFILSTLWMMTVSALYF
jgi:hypothetical protein